MLEDKTHTHQSASPTKGVHDRRRPANLGNMQELKHAILVGGAAIFLLLQFGGIESTAQQLSNNPIIQANFVDLHQIGENVGNVTQMTFGPDGRLYIATFNNGVKRYDYSPTGGLSNPITVWSRAADFENGQFNGSIGISIHKDPVLGPTMYLAPAVSSSFNVTVNRTQSLIRLTDDDNDGNWGESAEVNQEIVDNLRVTDLHQANHMVVRGDTLYLGIGSRTRTGGERSEYGGTMNPDDGEFAYTGAINWIRDLTQLSNDTTTPNIAGFAIDSHATDTRPFTSSDMGKLTVYSTGLRNVYGLAFDGEGQLWATMNQNEDPLKPDELHRSDFQDDHQFPKINEVGGDWKSNAEAKDAGYFESFVEPVSLLGDHASADGLDFTYRNHRFAGHAFVVRFARGKDLLSVNPTTGATTRVATGFSSPLDVLTDPFGNLLVGTYGGGGSIYRLELLDNAGDYNNDGAVDLADYTMWRDTLGQTGAALKADGNGNNRVDQADYVLWKTRFDRLVAGAGRSTSQIAEPEALPLMILIVSVLAMAERIKHRVAHGS
jgi:glucose/arabinose dehydrogenase